MIHVLTVETPGLGDRSYLVHDGEVGVAIDPQRDVDRMLDAAATAGVRIGLVAETHLHNDYVSGGLDLARRTRAEYIVNAADDVLFRRRPISAGDVLQVGELRVEALASSGHTPTHLSYVVRDGHTPPAVFTGGSMLFGTVGRTDLLGDDLSDRMTREQWRSVRRLAMGLSEAAQVFPTHGFGSFCSSAKSSGVSASTIGQERRHNLACTTGDEDGFVRSLLAGLTAYPRYYAHMAEINRSGPAPFEPAAPPPADAAEVARRIATGQWVVDLRPRRRFAAAHLPGSIGIEAGDSFATYLGWLIPWGTPLTLIGGVERDVADVQRGLARIGIDRLAGASTLDIRELTTDTGLVGYEAVDFSGAAAMWRSRTDVAVLDVRRADEWQAARVRGAVHVPLHELQERFPELPGVTLLVHCASGFRASIAASLLHRSGRNVVLVDDDFDNAAAAGMPVEEPASRV